MDNIDDQFSLKWNNFQSNLATGFHDLLQEEMMVDVTLAAEGKFLQAHKIILSVCSPYFKDLFKVNPCKHPIVILKDVGHQEMADMLDFMYRGEANVRQEDLAAFLKLAETLKVKGLAGDKQGEDETPPPSSQAPRKSAAPQQVPKKKKIIETSVFESDDHDPGDSDYNPGGGEPRRKKRRSSPPPKTETVMPSASSSTSAQPFPLANPKQEMPDPEEIQLIDDNDEANDPLVQLISGQGTKQEHDQQDFDDSNFDNTLEDTGDGSHETDFDMSAGPSGNPDESTDQVPQALMARILENIGAGASLTAVAALKCCKEWTVIGGRVLHKPDLIDLEDKKEKALMRAVSNFTGETMKKILTKRELENSTLTGTSSPFNVKPTVKEQLDPTVADGICDFIGKEFGLMDAKKYKPKIRSYIRAVLNNYSCKKEKNKGN